jgi:hypothetical protein
VRKHVPADQREDLGVGGNDGGDSNLDPRHPRGRV